MILYAEKYENCMTESVGRIILSYNKDNNSYKNNTSSNSYNSYDDEYMDGDYDDDRYNSNSDYADGVDDAIEDDYEEGYGDW